MLARGGQVGWIRLDTHAGEGRGQGWLTQGSWVWPALNLGVARCWPGCGQAAGASLVLRSSTKVRRGGMGSGAQAGRLWPQDTRLTLL